MSSFSCSAENGELPDLGLASPLMKDQNHTNGSKDTDNNIAKKTAEIAINEAQLNFNNLTSEGLKSEFHQYGKGMVSGAVQSKAEELLSPYGHINANMAINDDGSFDGSSLDYLVPWDQGESTILFSQVSVHNKDDRTIANLGAGIRENVGHDWLVGGNVFYDYDISRGHRRLGLGTEAWTDFFKLSGNYYLPLSSWKDSPDIDDYEERPARGWDVRLQAYLPAYPQLGSSLVYEKYYGKQVALFGTDELERNPSAATLGVNYTPVPMITVGADYKKGSGDKRELSANIALDYRIGVPLAVQLDPLAVKLMRTLAGSRLDFVDRNNDIVLEYREKNDLDIGLYLKPTGTAAQCILGDEPDSAQAYEGCHWTLNATITSHLKIKSAQWIPAGSFNPETALTLPALLPQQNISPGIDNHWQLTFPAWINSTDVNANKYTLSVMLSDDKGHTKQSNAVSIVVSEAPTIYELAIANNDEQKKGITLLADGKSAANLVASGTKTTGLKGETTLLTGENMQMKFHAFRAEDKSHAHEVTIHSSEAECKGKTDCLFYSKSPDHGVADISSSTEGVFAVIATPVNKDTQKTNPVVIQFSGSEKQFVTAIVDTADPTVNLTEIKGNKLTAGHEYQFKVAYDSNKNGKWDASDRETVSETNSTPLITLVKYRWLFDGQTPSGNKGGYATPATDNRNMIIPERNSQAGEVFAGAGADGIQGYELKVDYHSSEIKSDK